MIPILYYWAPCRTCSPVVHHAEELGVELDLRDIEQEEPYQELLNLGGVGDNIPYLYIDGTLIQGVAAIDAKLEELAASV